MLIVRMLIVPRRCDELGAIPMRNRVSSSIGWYVLLLLFSASLSQAATDQSLLDAVKRRDVEAVQTSLRQGADVNAPLPDGTSIIYWAVQEDDLAMVNLLIKAGAQVNAPDEYGVTPLWLATVNRSGQIVEKLLEAGSNANAARPSGETVLMRAARTGSPEVLSALIEHGAKINVTETLLGQTALMWAAAEGHADSVQALLNRGADVRARSKAGYTPFLLAARNIDLNTVKILLDAGADVNEPANDGTTALVVATIRGNLELAKFLLARGADPNLGPGFSPLHWAVGQWSTAEALSSGRKDENSEWKAFEGLQGESRLEFVKLLLASGANPSAPASRTPGYQPGRAATAARPSTTPAEPQTPAATQRGNLPSFFGSLPTTTHSAANVTQARAGGPYSGATPFFIAAKTADLDMMRLLLANGADPRLATNRNTTPLMAAAGVGSGVDSNPIPQSRALEAIQFCLDQGSDINAVNIDGETALHGAAYRGRQGSEVLIQFLADKGANINAKNKFGWTPLTIVEGLYFGAQNTTWKRSVELLQKLGAEPTPANVDRLVGTTATVNQ
jgi:ankyrin repeat protein